ncbi:MAG: ribosomal protein S18-alanine N-acetyltransferase [Candidatus Acidiferrum sp.]
MWKPLQNLPMKHNPDATSESQTAIRKYVPGDSPAITALAQSAPEAAQWPASSYEQAAASGQTILVADDGVRGQEIRGFLVSRFVGAEGEILNVAVDSSHRRKGVGSRLLAAVLEHAKTKSVERIYLEVRESNGVAIAFYTKHGFEKTGQRTNYYRDPTENAVVLEKKLTG